MSNSNGQIHGVLAAFSWGCLSGSKRDPTITAEVLHEKNAGDDAGSWSNKLFPPKVCGKKNAFTDLRGHLGRMRAWHYANTFVFEDSLWRILPEKRIQTYKTVVEIDGKARAKELLDDFVEALPLLKEMAKLPEGRGAAYKESDYPTPDEIREKFHYSVDYRPIPSSAGLNPELMQEAIDKLNELHAQRLQEANLSLVERFITPFKTLSEQLANPEGRKMATVIQSIRDVTAMIPSLDLSGNAELITAAQQMSALFDQVKVDALKKDEEMQKLLATTCQNVVGSLSKLQVGARKFA